jgi:hypothetical protein
MIKDLKRYPYEVGDAVEGIGFSGIVTSRPGPYSVQLDGRLTVSVTMITRRVAP